ncbi:type III PLP-dependent enzyme [Streptomyces silvisoli]|uniref:Type III PLP-dependent enzyme n=1 Tax=Streptomyces silvisoli TaxID=3034235 RepID=A0ABT5ZT29_9ACTN|nr:type III PLP-dependent enzyme [Streptomyces silvisoli]MDF3292674.1 type III PLP-dependent enzyme [Streptomyces silvisoli]
MSTTLGTADGFQLPSLPASELAQQYGTPLFVYEADVLTAQYQGLRSRLDDSVEIFYSLKANPNVAVCQLLYRLGAGAEVSSLAELAIAQRAGVAADRTIFLGPGKSEAELSACARGEVGLLIAESLAELDHYDELVAAAGRNAHVLLRVNPEFSVKGAGLTMGGKPRQFGIDEAELLACGPVAGRWPHLRVVGIQAYMGTRILTESVVAANTERILALSERITERLGCPLDVVDIGGGLGVAYFDGERDLDPTVLTDEVNAIVRAFHARHPDTRVLMELGRYLTATAGTYIVTVRYVKESFGEPFAIADGGTNHHMAAVGTGSFARRNFPVALLNRAAPLDNRPWNVSGPLCTPNDLLVKKAALPRLRPGDLVGIARSGAYGPSASPGLFLSHGFPAEVMVLDGTPHLVRLRDGVDDLVSKQLTIEDF